MMLSYVLRLVPEALVAGRFAGTLQVVDTGRTVTFASVDELVLAVLPRPRDGDEPTVAIDLDAVRALAASRTPGEASG